MVDQKKYKVLCSEHLKNEPTENAVGTLEEDRCLENQKHGVWCTLKTKLRLKKRTDYKKHSKQSRKSSKNADDEQCLLVDSTDSIDQTKEQYAYRGKRVDFAFIPDKYALLEEIDCEASEFKEDRSTEIKSDCGGQVVTEVTFTTQEKVVLIDKENDITMKEYLIKKWKGRRAKRVRKGIRTTTSSTWKYLKVGLQVEMLIPDATVLATAASKARGQRG